MKRKICVITGSRSEYGILYELIKQIRSDKDLKLSLVVSGMHLLNNFGNTLNFIKKDGFSIDYLVPMEHKTKDLNAGMALSVSSGITGFVKAFLIIKPDCVVVLGDRTEALSAAIAASFMNIPVAHIHGGDNARAGLDEMSRGAITKFSHIHFPATKKSARRIERLGEAKWRIFQVGSPAIDYLMNYKYFDKTKLFEKYGLTPSKPLILVVQHPVTTENELAANQISETLNALAELGQQTILIYPNSDAGGQTMIKVIKKRLPKMPFVKAFMSLPHSEYLSFMKYASVMVGNSSSGIIEAPFFQLPAVNIGLRQEGRERATNIIDVHHKKEEILKGIYTALGKKFRAKLSKCTSPYGDGHASERIIRILKKIDLTKKMLQKKMMEE
ncbi:MAG: UDP-N-acetylglucosamine 2-epimerase [Candidatus Micrarchaeia archaeon]